MDLKFYTVFPQSPQLDLLGCWGNIQVERYSWQAVGGPYTATFQLNVRPVELLAVPRLLGAPVQVWGPRLQRVWWGYIHSAEIGSARYSLDGLYNRVAASYGEGQFTDWIEDAASIRAYGVKEHLLVVPNATASAAAGIRDAFLEEHARPSARLSLDMGGTLATGVRLEARGWYQTLGWHYLQQDMDVAASGGGQADTWSAIGDSLNRRKLAQSISIPAGETWTLRRVELFLKRTGEPGDRLLVRLHADQGGSPGECLANARFDAADADTSGGWVDVDFDSAVDVGGGALWLVVNRSGGVDSGNYVSIGTQNGGTYRVYDGSTWSTASGSLVGEVLGGEHRPGNEIIQAAFASGGAFLTRLSFTAPRAPFLPMGTLPDFETYQDGTRTALQVLEQVLAAGSAAGRCLLARVTEQRKLQVYPQPLADETTLRLENGLFYDGMQQVRPWDLACFVGRWVSTLCGDVFVDRWEYRSG